MKPEIGEDCCIYMIDADDLITLVGGNWLSFAAENRAEESCQPDRIIGRPIWEFINGDETTHLYEIVLDRIRQSKRGATFPFRCDSPDRRRYLQLEIAPIRDGAIEFRSRILREEEREPLELMDPEAPRSKECITMCSMCKKIRLSGKRWVEVEAGIEVLQLFSAAQLPLISHGLCDSCYDFWMASLPPTSSDTP